MGTVTAGLCRLRGLLLIAAFAGVAVVAGAVGAVAADHFSDVGDDHPFHDEIGWMAEEGITTGFDDGTYKPGREVTRQAMAAFLQRVAGHDSDVGPVVNAATVQGLGPDELGGDVSALEDRVADLEALLAGVSRQDDAQGRDTLRFEGMNVQVVNGTGTTDGAPDGLGNLIIGYDTERGSGSDKSGSHYLVVGDEHNYTAFGGLLVGFRNTATGDWASVSGGAGNTASGDQASVSGGDLNTASGTQASVSGGFDNTASGQEASVSGGAGNTADALGASILGGDGNTVSTTDSCHPGC